MAITFSCPFCRHKLTCPDTAAGKQGKCKCGRLVVVPRPAPSWVPDQPAPPPVPPPLPPLPVPPSLPSAPPARNDDEVLALLRGAPTDNVRQTMPTMPESLASSVPPPLPPPTLFPTAPPRPAARPRLLWPWLTGAAVLALTATSVLGYAVARRLHSGSSDGRQTSERSNDDNRGSQQSGKDRDGKTDDNRNTNSQKDPVAAEKEKLKGVWLGVTLSSEGVDSSAEGLKWVFSDTSLHVLDSNGTDNVSSYAIDPTKKPKELDIIAPVGSAPAIYELEGDTLRVCVSLATEKKRPTSLKPSRDFIYMTMVFKRGRPGDGNSTNQGEWKPWHGVVEDLDAAPNRTLTEDYCPYEKGSVRTRLSVLYFNDGKTSRSTATCTAEDNGVIVVQTFRMEANGSTFEGAGFFKPRQERQIVEGGYVRYGRFAEKPDMPSEIEWERLLKIGAHPGESWAGDPAKPAGQRKLEGFGKYRGQDCAVVSEGLTFWIFVKGRGLVLLRSYYSGGGKLSFEAFYD
jgi:uncharacterized protein (TIGR03067 family)